MDNNLIRELGILSNLILSLKDSVDHLNNINMKLYDKINDQTIAINNLILAYNNNVENTNYNLNSINDIKMKLSDMDIKNNYMDDEIKNNSDKINELCNISSEIKSLLELVISELPYRWGGN